MSEAETKPSTDWSALGSARLRVAREATTAEQWRESWPSAPEELPFRWGSCWTATMQYRVADFAAEIGFFIDGLGFTANALDQNYCMFAAPDRSYFFSIVPADEEHAATPPDALTIGFMAEHVEVARREIEARGIEFSRAPEPYQSSSLLRGELRTPNGILVELWGQP